MTAAARLKTRLARRAARPRPINLAALREALCGPQADAPDPRCTICGSSGPHSPALTGHPFATE